MIALFNQLFETLVVVSALAKNCADARDWSSWLFYDGFLMTGSMFSAALNMLKKVGICFKIVLFLHCSVKKLVKSAVDSIFFALQSPLYLNFASLIGVFITKITCNTTFFSLFLLSRLVLLVILTTNEIQFFTQITTLIEIFLLFLWRRGYVSLVTTA